MTDRIKLIFEEVFHDIEGASAMIEDIFSEDNIFARDEMKYVYEWVHFDRTRQSEYDQTIRKSLKIWLSEFKDQR